MRRGVIIICIILAVFTESCLMRNGKCIRFIPDSDNVPAMSFSYGPSDELNLEILLWLFEDGSYIVSLREPPMSIDILGLAYPISFGKYTKEDNRYLLRDIVSNYQMEATLTGDKSFIFERGLLPLNHKALSYYGTIKGIGFNIAYECGQIMDSSKIKREKRWFAKQVIIDQGIFPEYNKLNLDLQPDGRYEFDMKGTALSRGQWTQLYDYIVLNDESVNSAFYFRIRDKNTLIGVAIPTTYHRENKSERVFTRE